MSGIVYIADIVKASVPEEIILIDDRMGYDQTRLASDLTDNEFATVGMLGMISGGDVFTIPAGTPIPFFIDISLHAGKTANTEVITKATSYDPSTGIATGRLQRWYDMLIEDQDTNNDGTGDFTGWNIYGHDDGAGNFKEDTIIILKG
jgi:hypothetical protein